jgi:PHD/YefM family antitoxin component YafN of YafNO toxin-antitoxin module
MEVCAMTHLTANQLRDNVDNALNRVVVDGERLVLRRNGRKVAAIIPIEDLKVLEAWEDRRDAEEAEKALKEFQESGQEAIPYEKIREKLGLK